jgi:hypothetical protein
MAGATGRVTARVDGRRGVVLPLLLLCLLALTAVATVALHTAAQEVVVARAALRLLQARMNAEGGVRAAVAAVNGPRLLALREGVPEVLLAGALGSDGQFRVEGHRLRGDFILLESTGIPGGGEGGRSRVGRLVWVLDPVGMVASFRAALIHGGSLAGEGAEGGRAATEPEEWPADVCSGHREALDSIFPFGGIADAAPATSDEQGDPILGILSVEAVIPISDRIVEGIWTPGPHSDAGTCSRETLSNWGAPTTPGGTCGDFHPLVTSPGSLRLQGGEGQGVLVVTGDLEMAEGAYYAGLVLVGGDLTLEARARIDGLVRVRGNVRLDSDATIRGSGCAALRALAEASGLGRIVPAPEGSWLGVL